MSLRVSSEPAQLSPNEARWRRYYDRMAEGGQLNELQERRLTLRESLEQLLRLIDENMVLATPQLPVLLENGLGDLINESKETGRVNEAKIIGVVQRSHNVLHSRLRYVEGILNDALRQKKMDVFWPEGMENTIRQGGSGDCYFLGALDALKGHPEGREIILDHLDIDQRTGEWVVTFPGDPKKSRFNITQADLDELTAAGKSIKEGALGDRVLERAYARLIKERLNGHKFEKDGPTVTVGKMDFEGGFSENVFIDLCGDRVRSNGRINAVYALRYGLLKKKNNNNRVFACSTFQPEDVMKRSHWKQERCKKADGEYIKYEVTTINGKSNWLYAKHAYSIKTINEQEEWLELANPHNTSVECRIRLSFQEFGEKMAYLSMAEFLDEEAPDILDPNEQEGYGEARRIMTAEEIERVRQMGGFTDWDLPSVLS